MRKAATALVLFFLTIPCFAGTLPEIRRILTTALENERQAAARYDAFAAKATEQGYEGAAQLFRACAKAERVHAQRFMATMEARGIPVPAEGTFSFNPGNTEDNLRAAAAAEIGERDGMYRDAIETAQRANDEEIAKIFDQTRDAEVEHANLCATSARNMESMKSAHRYFVCDECGYTTDIDLPLCPSCRVNKHPHSVD